MTRETGMATKADLKRLKHKENCKKLSTNKNCDICKIYKYHYWKCEECGVVGYTDGIESHTCPGYQIHEPANCEEYAEIEKKKLKRDGIIKMDADGVRIEREPKFRGDLSPFQHGEEGTHHACGKRIKAEGKKVRCCTCVPHKGCENAVRNIESNHGGNKKRNSADFGDRCQGDRAKTRASANHKRKA